LDLVKKEEVLLEPILCRDWKQLLAASSILETLFTPPTATWKPEDLDDTASVTCAGAASEFDSRVGYEVSTSGPY
jgi:hypothetical protein